MSLLDESLTFGPRGETADAADLKSAHPISQPSAKARLTKKSTKARSARRSADTHELAELLGEAIDELYPRLLIAWAHLSRPEREAALAAIEARAASAHASISVGRVDFFRRHHPGCLFLFCIDSGWVEAEGEDAHTVATLAPEGAQWVQYTGEGPPMLRFSEPALERTLTALLDRGRRVAIVERVQTAYGPRITPTRILTPRDAGEVP